MKVQPQRWTDLLSQKSYWIFNTLNKIHKSTVRVIYLGFLQKGSWYDTAHALLNTTIKNNISPLIAQYWKCACVTIERTPPHWMLFDRWIAICFAVPLNKPSRNEASQTLNCGLQTPSKVTRRILTEWSRVTSSEANSRSAGQDAPRRLRNPNVHCRVHTSFPLVPLTSHINPFHILIPYFFKIHVNTVLYSIPGYSK
jgi:hypothetical protein